jgi:peptidoglycan/LPS O-acetylase OafA/YrhL
LDVRWGDLGTTNFFFLISGYLIAQSLLKNNNILNFLKNRFLRLFPAIIFANILIVSLCYVCANTDARSYFFSKDVFYFMYRNTILYLDIRPRIGFGVFSENVVPAVTNPQWWTLPWNIKMYLVAIVLFSTLKILRNPIVFNLGYLLVMTLSILPGLEFGWWNVILPHFFTGIAFYINRNKIPIHWFYFALSVLIYLLFYDSKLMFILSPVLIAYMLIYFAFIPLKLIEWFKSFPDLSLGIFLYHMVIQQLLIFYGFTSVYLIFIFSLAVSAIFSYVSLKLIEIPIQKFNYRKTKLTQPIPE